MTLLSIVVPCFNEEKALPHLYEALIEEEKSFPSDIKVEMIFVNDASKDQTLKVIKDLRQNDIRVQYVSFSRNFGKEGAILAGLEKSKGDLVVIMDADMQDPPKLLTTMLSTLTDEDIDCVAARRVTRHGEPKIRSFFARLFYKLINRMSDVEFVDGARDYRMMRRPMVDAILSMQERNRFSKGLFSWVGFHTKWLEYENVERVDGETKWSFWKLLLYSFDAFTAFTTAPLALASVTGLIMFLLSIFFTILIVIRTWIWGDPVSGWPSTASIILFIGGIQLLCIGILGQYLAKTYMETKKRPHYITREESKAIDQDTAIEVQLLEETQQNGRDKR